MLNLETFGVWTVVFFLNVFKYHLQKSHHSVLFVLINRFGSSIYHDEI